MVMCTYKDSGSIGIEILVCDGNLENTQFTY